MRSSLLLATTLLATPCPAMEDEGYRLPPPEVVELVDAPSAPSLNISPDGRWALGIEPDTLPSIADVSRPMLRLAGMRIDPAANARYRSSFNRGLFLRDLSSEDLTCIPLPTGTRLVGASWSHTSQHFAYTLLGDEGTSLWVARVGAPRAAFEATRRLSSVLTSGYLWSPDGASMIVSEVPAERGDTPTAPSVPTGPNIRETSGSSSPLRTYQDLLTCPHDADLFDHHITAELCLVSMEGAVTSLGTGRFAGASVSPDGAWLLETVLERPYSYVMPASRFPRVVSVRPIDSRKARVLARKLAPKITVNAVAPGPFQSKMMAATLESFGDAIASSCPMQRIGDPDDMAGVAIYLASKAGAYVTGSVIAVDGGISTTK